MVQTTRLSLQTLGDLGPAVRVPHYERQQLSAGIVHIGVGNFHRAHQAVYLDRLFDLGEGHDWAIIGAGVRPADAEMRARLLAQDHLTTIVELAPSGHHASVTGSMIDFVEIGAHHEPLIAAMARPDIRIVSLTVTEGGYYLDAHGAFDQNHPDIVHDAANPDKPITAFGAILAALRQRRAAGISPFTVMSCDNVPGNGDVSRNTISGLAELDDPEFAGWVREHVAFPNGMVDRITPATGARERELVKNEFGVEDAAPVLCEPFMQWVLEDHFPTGRPALEKVGVTFTDRVHAFETMKIRILNGGHAIIAYAAGLLDIEFAHEAMQDDQIGAFLRKVETEEVVPHVPPVPDTDLVEYLSTIEQRFANRDIGDAITRLCHDGSNRQPKFIVPSVRDNLASGMVPEGLALVSALWCRYCYGETESGRLIAPNDPNWDALVQRARAARDDPAQWLAMRDIYGDASSNPQFQSAFAQALRTVWEAGTRQALASYLSGQPAKA